MGRRPGSARWLDEEERGTVGNGEPRAGKCTICSTACTPCSAAADFRVSVVQLRRGFMKRPSLLTAFGALVLAGATGSAAMPDTVRIETGLVSGAAGATSADVRAFKGIPYAAPPVGELRWRPPLPAARWDGVRKGEQFGARCGLAAIQGQDDWSRVDSGRQNRAGTLTRHASAGALRSTVFKTDRTRFTPDELRQGRVGDLPAYQTHPTSPRPQRK